MHSHDYQIPQSRFFALILSGVLLVCSFNSNAQQTAFYSKKKGQEQDFSYQWQHENAKYSLIFSIAIEDLYAMPDSPSHYSHNLLQEFVYRTVMQAAQKMDPTLAQITITRRRDGLSYSVKSRDSAHRAQVLQTLSAIDEKARNTYWEDNLLIPYVANNGKNMIRHDHASYAHLSSNSMHTIVEAIKQIQVQDNNPREFLQIALTWVQSIPYNSLDNRRSSSGAGFISPRDLLLQNQGDCDSKSTLLAALLKAYNPRINMQMVNLPNHALLAIAMRNLPDEMTITQKGIRYVLIEPVGPAQVKIGKIADTTKLALRNQQFDLVAL